MKAVQHNLRLLTKLLILILLFQSCSIYRSKSVSIDRAVEFNRKVKLKTQNNRVFKFQGLKKEGAVLYGIARANSKAAKLMAENIVEKNYKGKFVKIGIEEDSVKEIRLKKYALSVIVPIAIVIFVGAGVFITVFILAVAQVIPFNQHN
jgi:hypothetical protein